MIMIGRTILAATESSVRVCVVWWPVTRTTESLCVRVRRVSVYAGRDSLS